MGYEHIRRPVKAPVFNQSASSGEGHVDYVENVTSTGTNFQAHGLTQFGATVAVTYLLDNPSSAGIRKDLFCNQSTSGFFITVNTATTDVLITSTDGSTMRGLDFDNDGEAASLISVSSSGWFVLSHIGTSGVAA